MSALRFPGIKVDPNKDRISLEEFRKLKGESDAAPKKPAGKARSGKYNAVPVQSEHGYFHSTSEYKRFLDLKMLERANAITNLRRQVKYPLVLDGVQIQTYIADFVYIENGREIVEDFKGFRTSEYLKAKRLMKEILGIEILETGRSKGKSKSR